VRVELPLLMFKVMAGTDQTAPADLSFLSVFAEEGEHVYGLGTFMELGKIYSESFRLDGEKFFQYKTAEVHPTLNPNRKEPKIGAAAAKQS